MSDQFYFYLENSVVIHLLDTSGLSERVVEPLIDIMQATTKAIWSRGAISHQIGSHIDRDIIFDAFTGAVPIQYRLVMDCNAYKHLLRHYVETLRC
jgi:hypothetical protein